MFKQLKSFIYNIFNFIKSKFKNQSKVLEESQEIKVVSCKVRYIKTEKQN